jgi:hypothetical protein
MEVQVEIGEERGNRGPGVQIQVLPLAELAHKAALAGPE